MAHVLTLGAGVMGAAMSLPVHANGHQTTLLGTHLDSEIIRSVAGNGYHPGLKVTLPDSVTAGDWTGLSAALQTSPDLILLGVSSAGVDWAIERLVETMTAPTPILMITKGLATPAGGIDALPLTVARALKDKRGFEVPVSAVAGPAIAGEQAAGHETSVILTGTDMRAAGAARDILAHAGYRITLSDDLVGVELCAALKNFYALGVGAATGWFERAEAAPNAALMNNAIAALFTQALAEMARLVVALNGRQDTVMGLAGVGDLWVTCRAGRNSRMGRLLGLGLPYSDAKSEHMPRDTVEGAELAKVIGAPLQAMFADGRLDAAAMPLTTAILDAINDEARFPASLDALFTRSTETPS